MDQSLAISITLCYQFESSYYNTKVLKSCILQATEEAEGMLENVNLVFEDIEESINGNVVHENVINSIRKSHIILFELSDVNPNVLYELGIANGLKKPIIILREANANTNLPTDINQFIYLTYDKNKLDKFHHKLSKNIIKLYNSYDELDFISDSLQVKIVDKLVEQNPNLVFEKLCKYNLVKVLTRKDDFSKIFNNMIKTTNTNLYYIGAMGFLVSENDWAELYIKQFQNNIVFSRIVYLKNLKDFYEIYDDEDILLNYCTWLALNYYLVKNKIISLKSSSDVSIWKNGISFVVSDEEKILLATGSFSYEYNTKGIYIQNKEISKIFKEYAKILSIKSTKVKSKDIIKCFSFDEEVKKLPEEIEEVLDKKDFCNLRKTCEKYISQFV